MSAIIFQIQSTLIVGLMIFGVMKRRQRSLHVKTMVSVIVWDILLVLQIELNRGALAKAVGVAKNYWLLNFHVSIAVTTVIIYFALIMTGRKILAGNNEIRTNHKKLGFSALILRLITYITSFMIVNH